MAPNRVLAVVLLFAACSSSATYVPPYSLGDAEERGKRAAVAERDDPLLHGMYGGIWLHHEKAPAPPAKLTQTYACRPGGLADRIFSPESDEAAKDAGLHFTTSYLPSGFVTEGSGFGRCVNGTGVQFGQTWTLPAYLSWIGISYQRTLLVEMNAAPKERYSIESFGGFPAVVQKPLTEEGWGHSAIVIIEPGPQVLVVRGQFLPFSELIRIAEGVKRRGSS